MTATRQMLLRQRAELLRKLSELRRKADTARHELAFERLQQGCINEDIARVKWAIHLIDVELEERRCS